MFEKVQCSPCRLLHVLQNYLFGDIIFQFEVELTSLTMALMSPSDAICPDILYLPATQLHFVHNYNISANHQIMPATY